MKKKFLEIVKEMFISILIVVCIGVIVAIAFYDKLALTKEIPKAEEYSLTAEMQNELKNSQLEAEQETIINYYIDAADLKNYEKHNQYIKGKTNPFAEVSNLTTENGTSSNESENQKPIQNNGSTGGFYEDDGTK